MHELAVTESILEIATRNARQSNASKVNSIQIVVGSLSSIVNDSVQFYWDILSKDTICEASVLTFKRIPAKIMCLDCQHTYELENELSPCPNCQGANIQIISGEEFYVESIEIEKSQE
jgi:hydrogenase nickel incorporation protein HypA/HybF